MSHKYSWKFGVLAVVLFYAAQLSAEEYTYGIQPGDVLIVSVWKEADLHAEVLVRPDGGFSMPLVGNLQIGGLTVEQAAAAVTDRIKRYVPDPVVTIAVKQIGGNRIYVVGKVSRPGEFPFSRPLDVMQALSLAGGGTPYASLSDIRILRRDEHGKQQAIRFDYSDAERGKNLDKNVILKSGDTVVVP
jgi:polysaccharide biosynthesis/export protein